MGEWREVELDAVAAEITVGHVGSMASEYVGSGIPFLRSLNVEYLRINRTDLKFVDEEFHAKLRKSALAPGDVVIVRTGKPGTCAVIPSWLPVANCSDLVIVRCGPQLNPQFLAYFVNAMAGHHVAAHTVGAVQQHFNVGSARTMRLRLPPVSEQRKISAILGAFDSKIDLNRRMGETLEATARALFKSWFVDFDPVRPGREWSSKEISQYGSNFFPTSFEESELGETPSGWRVAPLSSLGFICREMLNPQAQHAVQFSYFSIPAYDDGQAPRAELGAAIKSQKFKVPSDAVLLSKLNPEIDRVWLVDIDDRASAICSTEFLVFQPTKLCTRVFLYSLMKSAGFRTQMESLVTGTSKSHQRARPEAVLDIPVVVPPAAVMTAFDSAASPLLAKVAANRRESQVCAALRDTLLPKLISGELRIKDAERFVEATV